MVRRPGWSGWWLHTETGLIPDPRGPEPHRIERGTLPSIPQGAPVAVIEFPPCTRNRAHGNRWRKRNAQGWLICTECNKEASARRRARLAAGGALQS